MGSFAAISDDGRYVAFQSNATNLDGTDSNGMASDIYVHERQSGETARLSIDSSGSQGNNGSVDPSISNDGRHVAFGSSATNLDGADANGTVNDVYVSEISPVADADGDGVPDDQDVCPAGDDTVDADGDGTPDFCDICAFDPDDDGDGDGICALDAAGALDNCPAVANADQLDTDGDSGGNACDLDDDGDGAEDVADNCPLVANADQADFDGDRQGDACDADIDGDGVNDAQDVCLGSMPGEAVVLDLNSEELGCSIAQLCPCANPSGWRNHGAYVRCVARTSEDFLNLGLITGAERDAIVAAAGQFRCGHRR